MSLVNSLGLCVFPAVSGQSGAGKSETAMEAAKVGFIWTLPLRLLAYMPCVSVTHTGLVLCNETCL